VALITFILLGVHNPLVQVQLLVWIFVIRAVIGVLHVSWTMTKNRFNRTCEVKSVL